MGCNTTYLGTSKYLAKLRDARDRDDVTIGELVDSKFRNISETHKAQDDNGRLFLQHECSKNGKQKFFIFGTDENVEKLCRSLSKPKYFSQLMTIASMFCYLKREAEPNRCTKKT